MMCKDYIDTSIKSPPDGGEYSACLEDTYQRLCAVFDDAGITRVANVTGLDNIGIPVAMAIRPNAKSLSVSQGKGTSLLAAKVSACMEAIELYHAENIEKPIIFTSYAALQSVGRQIVNIRHLARSREYPFNPHMRRPWIEAYCANTHSRIFIPFEIIDINTTGDCLGNYGSFIVDTNGLAAGSTHEQAFLHGLYECVERDAIALWTCAPPSHKKTTYVDTATIDDPICGAYIDQIRHAGGEVYIWNAIADTGIPTFACFIRCTQNKVRPGFGTGTHLKKEVALLKAIIEAAQSRLTFISGARDDQSAELYKKQMQQSEGAPYAAMRPDKGHEMSYRDIVSMSSGGIAQDIAAVNQALSLCGVSTILSVDLTKEHIGIPVVRVLIPGLENLSKSHVRIPGERLMSRVRQYSNATH